MSSLAASASPPRRAAHARARALGLSRLARTALIAVPVAIALVAIAFVAKGGLQLERTTYVEIALMLGCAAICAAAVVLTPRERRPLYGGGALLAFAALAGVHRAVDPVVAGAVGLVAGGQPHVRLPGDVRGRRSRSCASRRALGAALLHGVALGLRRASAAWALLTKVFPGALAADEIYARLREPFGYWNASGSWPRSASRRCCGSPRAAPGTRRLNALAWPGLGLLLVCMMLSYSRGALLAVASASRFWFAVVPLRLRGVARAARRARGAPRRSIAWAFAQDGLTHGRGADRRARRRRPRARRAAAPDGRWRCWPPGSRRLPHGAHAAPRGAPGGCVGAGLLAALALRAGRGRDRARLGAGRARRPGLQGLAPAHRPRTSARPPTRPNRLTATSSVRARYWDEALQGPRRRTSCSAPARAPTRRARCATAPSRSAVAPRARLRRADARRPRLAGLALSLLRRSARGCAPPRGRSACGARDRGLPWDAERVGLATLVAGRASCSACTRRRLDLVRARPTPCVGAAVRRLGGRAAGRCARGWRPTASRWTHRRRRRSRRASAPARCSDGCARRAAGRGGRAARRRRGGAADRRARGGLGRVPARALGHAGDAVFARVERSQLDAAANIAQIGHSRNPLSVDPLFELAYVETLRDRPQAALTALERAVRLQPANPEHLAAARAAAPVACSTSPRRRCGDFRAAYYLDPMSPVSAADFIEAQRAVAAREKKKGP